MKLRDVPMVFRISGLLLAVAILGGQLWQRQPASGITRAVLTLSASYCPSAAFRGSAPTVRDSARVLDRAVYRLLADRYAPMSGPRC